MMKKLLLLSGAAVGYVLGAKAGRERYDQIVAAAREVARDPRVRQKAREAQDAVKENAPVVKDKVAEAAGTAKAAAQDKLGKHEDTRTTAAAGAAYPGT